MLMRRFTRRSGSKGEGVGEKKKRKKLQGRAADRTHTSGRAEQHNTHTWIYSICISGGDENPAWRISGGVIVCDDIAR